MDDAAGHRPSEAADVAIRDDEPILVCRNLVRSFAERVAVDDVAAVVDSRPGTVFVLGHSYGGVAALEAAFLTGRISKLILYEPPLQDPVEHNLAVTRTMERLIKEGASEQAVTTFVTEVVHLSPSEVAAMKLRPAWPELVATVDAQVRQMYALAEYRFDATRMSAVSQPTLLLIGGETSAPY